MKEEELEKLTDEILAVIWDHEFDVLDGNEYDLEVGREIMKLLGVLKERSSKRYYNGKKMKTEEEREALFDKKDRLEAELHDIDSQLEWSYTDSGGTYRIELYTSSQVRILYDFHSTTEIVMPNDIFEQMIEFYQKLKGDEKEKK